MFKVKFAIRMAYVALSGLVYTLANLAGLAAVLMVGFSVFGSLAWAWTGAAIGFAILGKPVMLAIDLPMFKLLGIPNPAIPSQEYQDEFYRRRDHD
jgi:hypothetical protein